MTDSDHPRGSFQAKGCCRGSRSIAEVHVPEWALGEPVADQLCFVRAVVVHDDVNVEIGRHIARCSLPD